MTRTEYDGSLTVLLDGWQGKPLNSPNDVVVKSDGSVWFTDPPFGILGHYEGHKNEPQVPEAVYRVDPGTGEAAVVTDEAQGPNGLCFSPDERILYVVESRAEPTRKILAFDVVGDGRALANKRVLIDAGPGGTPDGMRCDTDGNLWCGWGMGSAELDGVMVFAPDGVPIGRIALPERCANVCFGGLKRKPPLHGRQPVALCALHERSRRGWRVAPAPHGAQAEAGAVPLGERLGVQAVVRVGARAESQELIGGTEPDECGEQGNDTDPSEGGLRSDEDQ